MKDKLMEPWIKVYFAFGRTFRWDDICDLPWFYFGYVYRYTDGTMEQKLYLTGDYLTEYTFTDKFIEEIINNETENED